MELKKLIPIGKEGTYNSYELIEKNVLYYFLGDDNKILSLEENVRIQKYKELLEFMDKTDPKYDEYSSYIDDMSDAILITDIELETSYHGVSEYLVESLNERYYVGTSDEMKEACKESLKDFYENDVQSLDGLPRYILEGAFDDEEYMSEVREGIEYRFNDTPEEYLPDTSRELSRSQKAEILILEKKIKTIENNINILNTYVNNQKIIDKIKSFNDLIDEYNTQIESIKESPEGGFSMEKIEKAIDDEINGLKGYEFDHFIENYELSFDKSDRLKNSPYSFDTLTRYIDLDKIIENIIDTDGLNFISRYDGEVHEVLYKEEWYNIIRSD